MDTAYAELEEWLVRGVKHTFYQIYFTEKSLHISDWRGPYRDKTDAENAAEDEAKVNGLELIWRS